MAPLEVARHIPCPAAVWLLHRPPRHWPALKSSHIPERQRGAGTPGACGPPERRLVVLPARRPLPQAAIPPRQLLRRRFCPDSPPELRAPIAVRAARAARPRGECQHACLPDLCMGRAQRDPRAAGPRHSRCRRGLEGPLPRAPPRWSGVPCSGRHPRPLRPVLRSARPAELGAPCGALARRATRPRGEPRHARLPRLRLRRARKDRQAARPRHARRRRGLEDPLPPAPPRSPRAPCSRRPPRPLHQVLRSSRLPWRARMQRACQELLAECRAKLWWPSQPRAPLRPRCLSRSSATFSRHRLRLWEWDPLRRWHQRCQPLRSPAASSPDSLRSASA
mmetsp:Transcript_125588/g.391003  ORF Transcript_125588/g.391003 Transcript_125588/m.391003 type:complete len:336 (+) Transcript_125588:2118-3125(+)